MIDNVVSINVDLAVIKLFNQIHANTFSKSNDLVNSVLVVNPSQERIQKEVLKKLQGKDPKLEQEAKRLMGYNWKYNGIQNKLMDFFRIRYHRCYCAFRICRFFYCYRTKSYECSTITRVSKIFLFRIIFPQK